MQVKSRVVVYISPMCPACAKLKRELDAKGVEYEEVDVSKSEEARERLLSEGLEVVPVIERNGTIVQVGYSKNPKV